MAWSTTLFAIAVPIVWTKLSAAISDIIRACVSCGLLIASCILGAAGGSTGWLAVNMGTGALVALVCRYPRHGGEAHRAAVPLYEDIAFCAGAYGALTCLCKVLSP